MAENYKFPPSAPEDFAIIKIKHLARISDLEYSQVRNCIQGLYGSLTDSERTRLYNSMMQEVAKAASALGFTVDGRRIRAKD